MNYLLINNLLEEDEEDTIDFEDQQETELPTDILEKIMIQGAL